MKENKYIDNDVFEQMHSIADPFYEIGKIVKNKE
jgi:hypothetical protein